MPPDQQTRDPAHHPLERAVDKSGLRGKFARLNAMLSEFRILVWIVVGTFAWLGWKTESPSGRMLKMEGEIVAVKDSIRSVRKGQDSTLKALDILVRLNCFDTATTFNEKRLAGLDCSDIESARRDVAP